MIEKYICIKDNSKISYLKKDYIYNINKIIINSYETYIIYQNKLLPITVNEDFLKEHFILLSEWRSIKINKILNL